MDSNVCHKYITVQLVYCFNWYVVLSVVFKQQPLVSGMLKQSS